jgi:hypothetical protein
MKTAEAQKVNESRAALLLAISEEELRRLSISCGIGQPGDNSNLEQVVYTYEELRKICLMSAAKH